MYTYANTPFDSDSMGYKLNQLLQGSLIINDTKEEIQETSTTTKIYKVEFDIHSNIFNPEDTEHFWYKNETQMFGHQAEEGLGGVHYNPTFVETDEDLYNNYICMDRRYRLTP